MLLCTPSCSKCCVSALRGGHAGGALTAPAGSHRRGGGGGKVSVAYASSGARAKSRVKEVLQTLPSGAVVDGLLDIGCADGSITGALGEELRVPPERTFGIDIAGLGEKCVAARRRCGGGPTRGRQVQPGPRGGSADAV